MPNDPALPASVINCAVYDRQGRRRDITLDAISDALAVDDGSFVWVGLYEPEDSILDKLQEEFALHDRNVVLGGSCVVVSGEEIRIHFHGDRDGRFERSRKFGGQHRLGQPFGYLADNVEIGRTGKLQ